METTLDAIARPSGGFAGRALWSDVVGRPDVERGLDERAVPRLERLVEVVDRDCTPWRDVT